MDIDFTVENGEITITTDGLTGTLAEVNTAIANINSKQTDLLCVSADFDFEAIGGEITITAYKGSASVVTIPAEIAGIPVCYVGESIFDNSNNIRQINLPNETCAKDFDIEKFFLNLDFQGINILNRKYAYRESDMLLSDYGETLLYYKNSGTTLTIPVGIKTITTETFSDQSIVETVRIPASLEYIDEEQLSYFSIESEPLQFFSEGDKLIKIEVDAANTKYKDIDGVLFSKDGKVLIKYPCCKIGTHYNIPDEVEIICPCAFFGCRFLNSIYFANVQLIKRNYRYYDRINQDDSYFNREIFFELCFSDCEALTTITVNFTNAEYKDIDGVLCTATGELLKYPEARVCVNYVIPDGVKYVNSGAFRNARLLNGVMISQNVTYRRALLYFLQKDNKKAFYCGTTTQWNTYKSENWKQGTENEFGHDGNVISERLLFCFSDTQPTEEGKYWHYVNGVPTEW